MKKSTNNSAEQQAKKKIVLPAIPTTAEVTPEDKTENVKQTKKDSSTPKEKASPVRKTTSKKNKHVNFTGLLFLITLSATALAAYDFWLLRLQVPVNAQVTNAQQRFELRITQLEQQLQTTKNQLSLEQQTQQNAQAERDAINAVLQAINEKLGRSTLAWHMAEVEYLLTVANHRLTLAQDRQTAIAVFEIADSRLQAIGDPSLLTVRKKIASELAALRAVPNVDIPGLAVQIGSLAEAVEHLPLMDKKRLAVATEKQTRETALEWREIPAAVWNDVKSLVQVRRHQQPTEPLLPPKQAWFLYQNLQLKLEQARLAVLQRNTVVFAQSLDEVSQWLKGYFDAESTAVISMQGTVKKLRENDLQPNMPDVSGSLRELRSVMNARSTIQVPPVSNPASKKAIAP